MAELIPKYYIVGGPSREELHDSLRLSHEDRTVTICMQESKLVSKKDLKMYVKLLGVESGDGHGWLGRGILAENTRIAGVDTLIGQKLEFYFNTKDRTGWIRLVDSW